MKAIVGVDQSGLYRSALHLLARLKIDPTEVDLLHTEEPTPVLYGVGFVPAVDTYSQVADAARDTADRLLNEAAQASAELGIPANRTFVLGQAPAQALMAEADKVQAEVIAVGSTRKPKYAQFFLGSVGRGLAIGAHQSVLIAKNETPAEGPLTVVFATDHSKYADSCAQLLERLRPQGIGRLVIVTATDEPRDPSAAPIPQFRIEVEKRSQALANRLTTAGIPSEHRIVEGEVFDVIAATMEEVGADLLILGARGHGFLERVLIGSVSLQATVASPYSVLLLRA
jgi:nucleotide-binding universal stress UspA family protein